MTSGGPGTPGAETSPGIGEEVAASGRDGVGPSAPASFPDVDLEDGGAVVREELGDAFDAIAAYAALLEEHGVVRGLIGPRELPRLWERHLLNCAAMGSLLPPSGRVADVGSGAGLPGIVLACLRPDLSFTLIETMQRRAAWLGEVVASLSLHNVTVTRARAEELAGRAQFDAVTARAVAPLDRLAAWCLPLLRQGGVLLALKGDRAAGEVESAQGALTELGGGRAELLDVSAVGGAVRTTVVRVERLRVAVPPLAKTASTKTRRRR